MTEDTVIDINKSVINGDIHVVKKWLKFAAKNKVSNYRFASLLRLAAVLNQNAIVKEFLRSNKIKLKAKIEALGHACRWGQLDVIKEIIAHLTYIKQTIHLKNFLKTASSYGQIEVVKWLLKRFSVHKNIHLQWLFVTYCALGSNNDVNRFLNKNGLEKCFSRAFMVACYNGREQIANWIKDKGYLHINWNSKCVLRDEYGHHSILTATIARGHRSLVNLFVDEVSTSLINESRGRLEETALHLAIWCENKDITELHNACGTGNFEAVRRLCSSISSQGSFLAEELFLNQQDNRGDTPLHFACKFGDMETVTVLLAHCVRTDIVNAWYLSPLQLALQNGNRHIAKYLKKHLFFKKNTSDAPKELKKSISVCHIGEYQQ